MAVLVSDGICDQPRIPAILDAASFPKYTQQVLGKVRSFLLPEDESYPKWQHLQEKVSSLKGVPLLLIIDNVPLADPSRISEIQSILAEIADCRWIMLCSQDEGARTSDVGKVFPQPTQVLFIQDLPRKAIRELSRKRNDLLEDNDLLVSVRRLCESFESVAGPDGLSA